MKITGWMTKRFSRLSSISVAILFLASTSVAQTEFLATVMFTGD
jgi:hypothetical protein